ncbi:MAG TPA: hypothetical protein VKB69_12520 [Micromonosporaceae bacterium]|nr:hypothetical protein [Micromonosporaceae bacterium]
MTMLRVDEHTHRQVMRIAREDYGGASVDETVRRLVDEHFDRACAEAVQRYAIDDPRGWNEYLAEASEWDATSADGVE